MVDLGFNARHTNIVCIIYSVYGIINNSRQLCRLYTEHLSAGTGEDGSLASLAHPTTLRTFAHVHDPI